MCCQRSPKDKSPLFLHCLRLTAQRDFLCSVYFALSGDYHYLDVWQHPPGTGYLEALPEAPPLPWNWLSEAEFETALAPTRYDPETRVLVAAPRELRVRMQRYAASVCVAPTGVAAVTCPRGDTVALFSTASGELVESHAVRDAGGVTTTTDGTRFLVTTGAGEMHVFDARTGTRVGDAERNAEIRWDNHAVTTTRT